MKYLLIIALGIIVSLTSATGPADVVDSVLERMDETPSPTEVEVVEIFRAMDTEELEAALVDGYPMPWLEEILTDETIPEKDRYWLDCRVRAAIAQDLHLFYDREGNPVYVDAKWIAPGEDYWREHVMVRPILPFEEEERQSEVQSSSEGILNLSYDDYSDEYIREPFSENSPTLMSDPPGEILNLYGERVGELAVVNRYVVLSRDASIGAVQSGGNERICNWDRTPYACILYPDGSFIERPFEATGIYRPAVSADGSTIVFICIHMTYPESDDQIVDAWVFDDKGQMINKITPPEPFYGTYLPQISPSGQYVCYSLISGAMTILNLKEGSVYTLIEPISTGDFYSRRINTTTIRFSPNGKFICLGGFSAGAVIKLGNLERRWISSGLEGINDFYTISCSAEARNIASSVRRGMRPDFRNEREIIVDGTLVYRSLNRNDIHEEMVISPSGTFQLLRKHDIHRIGETSLPIEILMIRGGE